MCARRACVILAAASTYHFSSTVQKEVVVATAVDDGLEAVEETHLEGHPPEGGDPGADRLRAAMFSSVSGNDRQPRQLGQGLPRGVIIVPFPKGLPQRDGAAALQKQGVRHLAGTIPLRHDGGCQRHLHRRALHRHLRAGAHPRRVEVLQLLEAAAVLQNRPHGRPACSSNSRDRAGHRLLLQAEVLASQALALQAEQHHRL